LSYSDEEISIIVRNILRIEEKDPFEIIPIAKGGSHRLFYRVRFGNRESAIFMHYNSDRMENNYYAALAGFLHEIGVSAPRIFYHDSEKKFLLMEDLGEKDLWHYRLAPWEVRRKYYGKTLHIANKLHSFRREDFPVAEAPMMEAFGPELYRWEHDYFLQNFVTAVCRITLGPSEKEALEKELALLVKELTDATPCLIHRDLQSQNIMICNDEPVLIDFQGMRYGNPFYDLGSLLYDPYVSFTEEEREELLYFYYGLSGTKYDLSDYRHMVRQAAVQRLMQALGAYGFLGLKSNHQEFLAYIPSGLDNLLDALGLNPAFEHLRELACRCRQSLAKALDV
jgi:N-acetylmuramate 1-kinase